LTAFLRQELQAPATAITDFLDMIIEDASRSLRDNLLPDLERMRTASLRLNAFVRDLVQSTSSIRQHREPFEEFCRGLRHDLRTPLNAIKGYSELLIEDMDGDGEISLRGDLKKLMETADQLLGQIDLMVAVVQQDELNQQEDRQQQLDIVADVLSTLQPLEAGDALRVSVHSSRVLVVDDNPANRDVLARRLMREGHHVMTATNGPAALELALAQEFDLVLLDLIMPEMSGFEVLRRLKAAEHTRHVPVIVISALDELDSAVRCIEAGAEDYLPKPFNPILLRARIGACLEKKWLRDREKQFIADLEREKRRSETLLLSILPQSIVNRMRDGEIVIADHIAEVTILFCDLVGFTAFSQTLPAERTIKFLGRIFSTFDRLASEHGVEKIKTIGDSYMAASGIPESQSDNAMRVAALSLRMMDALKTITESTGLAMQARIGIHTGPVVAGVIGTHKFVYDVWGDTVNTASRMESHSLPGRIQVSATTRHLLQGRFTFEPRGSLEIKGKGIMETFFLVDGPF
jgi:class 3 adenylate cyclase/ActR/RegA family two-component response regulator